MRSGVVIALAAGASAHGVIRSIEGDNGVTMPGLGIVDGTPRNCFANTCGSQADTAIMRDAEMQSGKYGALGWNQGKGNIWPETVMGVFMGEHHDIPKVEGASGATGVEDVIPFGLADATSRMANHKRNVQLIDKRQNSNFLSSMVKSIANLPIIGFAGADGKITNYPTETMVSDTAGAGAKSGLPTPDKDGIISMVYRQVNQDGAGPVSAAIDYTSGGLDHAQFFGAPVTQQVPGLGLLGLSIAVNTDYIVKVKTDTSKRCTGNVGNTTNVCVARIRNGANAGPFGGCVAFTNRD
ncbi:hypothetical protein MY4824_006098 [Beauveria thailandica]